MPVVWFTPEGPCYRDEEQRPAFVLVPLPLFIPLRYLLEEPYMDGPVCVRGKPVTHDG